MLRIPNGNFIAERGRFLNRPCCPYIMVRSAEGVQDIGTEGGKSDRVTYPLCVIVDRVLKARRATSLGTIEAEQYDRTKQ